MEQEVCPFSEKRIPIGSTHSLVFVPGKITIVVGGQKKTENITLNNLAQFCKDQKNPEILAKFDPEVLRLHGHSTTEPHWIFGTDNYIEETENKPFAEKRDYVKVQGYQPPNLLDAIIFFLSLYRSEENKEYRSSTVCLQSLGANKVIVHLNHPSQPGIWVTSGPPHPQGMAAYKTLPIS